MRRSFLKGVLLGGATLLAAPKKVLGQDASKKRPQVPVSPDYLPIMQGATTASCAQFSILVQDDPNIRIEIAYPDGTPVSPHVVIEHTRHPESRWIAVRARVSGLREGKEASLEIYSADGRKLDSRVFSTLSDVAPEKIRFVLASCMRDDLVAEAKPMWEALEAVRPDYFFMLGDNVYVDDGPWSVITAERIWRRYVETRLTLGFYRWKRLVPTIATWDDHDFGKNDKDSRWGMKEASRAVFDAMYAQSATEDGSIFEGPGIARGLRAYGHRFLLTDGRSFRSSRWARERNEAFWGEEQEMWMEDELASSRQPLWLLNGTQFFGAYRSSLAWSFEGNHTNRFRDFVESMQRSKAPVVMCSGDIHFSEMQEIEPELLGYKTYEITSSAMHSYSRALPRGNQRRIAATNYFNFCLVEAQIEGHAVKFDVTSIGAGMKEHFKVRDLVVSK